VFRRLEQSVFADALVAAKNDSVIHFFGGALGAVRQPIEDMLGVVGVDVPD
jgi:hypothetical protein